MDYWVHRAQVWVNQTYAGVTGYVPCPETGKTGWSTMYSLTRALQHELGITTLSDTFGDTTLSRMTAFGPISASTSRVNMKIIVEAAMYCKGYSGGGMDGSFNTSTQAGLVKWKNDMGFPAAGTSNSVNAKEMKALLTMDAYVLLAGGDAAVRQAQQWMNATYIGRRDYYMVPCDGYYSRNVQRGLILGIQYSIGMADGVANGNFGPGTRDGIRTKALLVEGTTDTGTTRFVKLFKAAMHFNRRPEVDWASSTFTDTTSVATARFQAFCHLPITGDGDYQTWCSLLVSTGDPERPGTASDCMTPLNAARAQSLKNGGYEVVGRYINGGDHKRMTPAEVQIIFDAGLRFFPIFQEFNNALSYFDKEQGRGQGERACAAAAVLGLPTGSIIYFAVDYDATGDEIRGSITPYFEGIAASVAALGGKYSVGIYGSRNVCSTVCGRGLAVSSFVSGMSTGFSGNLGFPLPTNWAFDQIKTLTLAAGTAGQLEIDKNIYSRRDPGLAALDKPVDQNAAFFNWTEWIERRAAEYRSQGNTVHSAQALTAFYLRTHLDRRYDNSAFAYISGGVDQDFLAYCNSVPGRPDPGTLRDPRTGMLCDVQHFAASLGSVFEHQRHADLRAVSLVDFGGWAGDLITIAADCYNSGVPDSGAYDFAYGLIGNSADQMSFTGPDMHADVDAMTVGIAVEQTPSSAISSLLGQRYASATAGSGKFREFVQGRFGGRDALADASLAVFEQTSDEPFSIARAGLWQDSVGVSPPIGWALAQHPGLFSGVCAAFVDVIHNKFIG